MGNAGPQLFGQFDMVNIWRQRALKMPAQRLRDVLIIDEGSNNMHGKNILRKVQLINLDKAGRGAKLWVPSCVTSAPTARDDREIARKERQWQKAPSCIQYVARIRGECRGGVIFDSCARCCTCTVRQLAE